MTSPDRDPRALRDPALKLTPGMEAAFAAASEYADGRPGVVARIIDADVLLESRSLTRRAPRNVVEIFIDTSGVIVVGTGLDTFRPVYRATVPLPSPVSGMTLRAFVAVLEFHGGWALRAIGTQAARGLYGTTSP